MILALDSSGKTAGVCIMQGQQVLYHKVLDQGLTHSETLLPLAAEAMAICQLTPADISLYAVTVGPGSFTGLRIGLSIIKGLALPHSTPVAAVSTLEAHARGCGQNGVIIPALDARRKEVYWAAFARSENDDCSRLSPDAAQSAISLREFVTNLSKPFFFVGDGAQICYNELDITVPAGGIVASSPALGAAKAAFFVPAQPAGDVALQYLRLSQAERERAARLGQPT